MMTVLVIIGLMASAVILTLPQEKPVLQQQSEALLKGVNSMAQASLITGTPAALALSKDSYALMTFENGLWDTAHEFEFAPGLRPEFTRETAEVKLSDKLVPLVMFEPNGLSTPFTLQLSDGTHRTLLMSDGDGRVRRGNES